jgi:hypothetical protein
LWVKNDNKIMIPAFGNKGKLVLKVSSKIKSAYS